MIKLNLGGDQGIVEISCWEEITSRPRYLARIDPQKTKVKEVIGTYEFGHKVHCGFPCNQPHNVGYLIVTEDGYETNIGNICGETLAGAAEFKVMRRRFDKIRKRQDAIESIQSCKAHISRHKRKFDYLWEMASIVMPYKKALTRLGGDVPNAIIERIRTLTRTGSSILTRSEKLSKEEIDREIAMTGHKPKTHFKTVKIGRVTGLGFFSPDYDLRSLLTLGVKPTLENVAEIDANTAADVELIELAKKIGNLNQQFLSSERAIDEARKFLNAQNLDKLEKIDGLSPVERKRWKRFTKSIPEIALTKAA